MSLAQPTTPSPGVRVIRIGIGMDLAGPNELATYLTTQKLKSNQEILIADVYEHWTNVGATFAVPADQNTDQYYCIVRPVHGFGVSDFNPDGPFAYNMEGLEIGVTGEFKIRPGVRFEGFRFNVQGAGVIALGGINTTGLPSLCGVIRSRIQLSGSQLNAISIGEYETDGTFTDNLVVRTAGIGRVEGFSFRQTISRNTFVALNGATGEFITAGGQATVENNAFLNAGAVVITTSSPLVAGNYTNMALTTPRAGVTVVTSPAFVENAATNFIPAATSPLLGNASDSAKSIIDNRSKNRGIDPDVGAWQRVAAVPLPTGAVTGSPKPNGQQWTVDFTTTQSPTSGIATLSPATTNPGNAIGSMGVVTLGNGSGQAVFSDIVPGNYQGTITISNNGGAALVTGLPQLSILEITGTPTAGETEGGEVPAPIVESVVITPATATGSTQFSATVLGQNSPPQGVNWSKVGGGTLSNNGVFVAPAKTNTIQTITIKAASEIEPAIFGLATVTIPALVVVPPDLPGDTQTTNRYARPIADIKKGDWAPSAGTSLASMVGEAVLDLNNYIGATMPTSCEILLGPVAAPAPEAVKIVRYEAHSPDGGRLTVRLKQGSTVIASRYHADLPTVPGMHELLLTPTESAAITDYNHLSVELEAS
jgi:hypothetical protein